MIEFVDIRHIWDRAREWIEEAIKKVGPQEWKPEDIYAACVNDRASAFCDAGDREGILIVIVRENAFTGQKYLFIWLAYFRGFVGDPIKEYEQAIMDLAKSNGCEYVEFESTRRGFERRPNWTTKMTTFRRQVRQ